MEQDQIGRKSFIRNLMGLRLSYRIDVLLILLVFVVIITGAVLVQMYAEKNAFSLGQINSTDTSANKKAFEVYKLAAEIRQIRSDTSGSLFWLKLVALFVTVGGAVGGYLLGQDRVNKNKINFEQRKNIDTTYQGMVNELSSAEPVLRAAAAVKLGAIIHNFPTEWDLYGDEKKNEKRKEELIQLTKNVLAATLSLEKNETVLKVISIALVPKTRTELVEGSIIADLDYIDFSHAAANNAYWANVNFSNSDFFGANLKSASFRCSKLHGTSFYDADLENTVFRVADCTQAYFNQAKLQGANFKGANLQCANFSNAIFDEETNFEGAKVDGMITKGSNIDIVKDVQVDVSKGGSDAGDENPRLLSLKAWLEGQV